MKDIEQKSSGILKFDFRELNDTLGNPHKNEIWRCFLIINGIDYYNCRYFDSHDFIRVPIPSGDVQIDFRLSNMSKLAWCQSRFPDDKTIVCQTVKPNEIVKIKIKSIDMDIRSREKMSAGAAGAGPAGFGCLFLMPREYYIHLDIEKIAAEDDKINKRN